MKKEGKKPITKKWWFWVIIAFIVAVIVIPSSPKEKAAETPTPTAEATAEPAAEEDNALKMNTGEILDVKENGDTLIVKAKVKSLLNNKQTVDQNYYNACEIIRSYTGDCTVLDYWAVADMSDGSEGKIISFVVPSEVFTIIKTQQFPDNTLGEYVTDLWILPSLK